MAVSYKGLVIKFGGDTTELQAALKKVQSASKDTQSDLKDINKALKFDPGNTELLEQKVKALNSAYDETKQKLSAYKSALESLESKKQSGATLTAEEERQYDSLKRAIMQCERQLESYEEDLKKTSNEAEASKTKLYQFGQTIQDNADKLSSAGSKMEKAGTLVSGSIIGAGTALSALAESQQESIAQTAQLNTAFETNGSTVEMASEVYGNFYRLIGESDTATEASQNLVRLTQNEEELSAWTDIAAGAYAQFGDALPLENLAEAAQETAHTSTVTGGFADALNWTTASLDIWNEGLSGHSAAQQAFNDAIAQGETKEDAFNAALAACSDESERSSLITETLTALYGEAGKQYQETNADLLDARDAQNEMNTAMAELGEAALPVQECMADIATTLLDKLSPALEAVTGWYKDLSPEQQELTQNVLLGAVAFGGVTTAVGKTLQKASEIGGAFKNVAETFTGAKDVISGGTGVFTTLKDGFGTLATKGGEFAGMLGGKLSTGWTAFTGLIAANPILLGVAAVAAAVAGLTWFFTQTETGKQMWSDFTSWITEKWEGVQEFFSGVPEFWSGVWDNVTGTVTGFVDGVGQKWDELKTAASNTWEGLKQGASDAWTSLKDNVGNLVGQTVDNAKNSWDTLKENTTNAFSNIKTRIQEDMFVAEIAGSQASSALQAAMNGDWSKAKQEAGLAFSNVKNHIQTRMSEAKQSAINIADAIGAKLGFPGLGTKVSNIFNGIKSSIVTPIQNAWNTISSIPSRIANAFSNIRISIPRPKIPHFTVSWQNIAGLVNIPKLSLQWYAKGGWFDQPSIIGVGEGGEPEHVAPDSKLRESVEAAVNKAFNALNVSGGQSIEINIELNASVANGLDAYTTGQQIGSGIASRLKQKGVSVATA